MRVCPWYLGYFLAHPLRRWVQDPEKIVVPHLRAGMRVLEIGPGMGFFTIPMARAVGPSGHVFCVEVQQKMLNGLNRRAARAGVKDCIDCRLTGGDALGVADLSGTIDFALLFAVVHEVPDQQKLFAEVSATLKPGARLLFSEPKGHVSAEKFEASLALARSAGLSAGDVLEVWHSLTRILEKRT